ncbi:Uncharacterised protein [Mycobacteroides abscessus subsp. massiliense]|nr:Uncharacterised protein [Mycobacteroides abscessus subsp. massiliense]
MSFPQQDLARPLAIAVPIGVTAIGRPGRADDSNIGVFEEYRLLDLTAHIGRRNVGVWLEFCRQRKPDEFGRAHHIGSEQLAIRQHAVDQCRRIDNQVDGIGQPLPSVLIQPEAGFGLISGDHL